MLDTALHDHELARFRQMIHRIAGISLSSAKKALVVGRFLAKRQKRHIQSSDQDYLYLISKRQDELQLVGVQKNVPLGAIAQEVARYGG